MDNKTSTPVAHLYKVTIKNSETKEVSIFYYAAETTKALNDWLNTNHFITDKVFGDIVALENIGLVTMI